MKKPDPWKHESWLRRILDAEKFDSIVYFEEAVLADSQTLTAKGYFLFLVTDTSFHYLQTSKDSSLQSSSSWLLTDFHSVLRLNDAATFFAASPEVAPHTRHIRCHISDQAASAVSVLDFYSFYEDSTLFHALFQAWQQAHVRQALPVFYPIERNKLSKLNKLAVQSLYNHLEAQLLASGRDEEEEAALAAEAAAAASAGTDNPTTPAKRRTGGGGEDGGDEQKGDGDDSSAAAAEAARARAAAARLRAKRRRAQDYEYFDIRLRTRLLEEMTLACCAHRSFAQHAFDSPHLIPFLLKELRSLGRLRMYMLPADPRHVWSLVSSRSDRLVEDEVDSVRYAVSLQLFFARLLSGSESIPSRTKLLAWNSTSRDEELQAVMDDLFLLSGMSLPPERGVAASMRGAGNEPLSPASPGGGGTGQGAQQLTPTEFLDILDAHVAAQEPAASGSSVAPARRLMVDEEDRRMSSHYLYNLRAQRSWKESILASHGDALAREAAAASTAATRSKLASSVGSLHVRDVPRIVAALKAEAAALAARRGPPAGGRRRNNPTNAEASLLPPRSAEELGDESVLLANEQADRKGIAALVALVPELEVSLLDLLFHFMQLLEAVLDAKVPFLTCNLEHLFQHLLLAESRRDFAQLQVPVFARGLVHLCAKERRPALSYYCFVYASVISKMMLRSAELQQLLEEQHFLALLAGPTRAAQLQHSLALLPDIKAATLAPNARGLHFYQRTKPLLQDMLSLMVNK